MIYYQSIARTAVAITEVEKMLNKDFKRDWRSMDGEITVMTASHFSIDIDKDYFNLSISVSWKFRLIYIALGHLVFRIY